jgi:hypothetical protein
MKSKAFSLVGSLPFIVNIKLLLLYPLCFITPRVVKCVYNSGRCVTFVTLIN